MFYWLRNFVWTVAGFNDLEYFEVASYPENVVGTVLVTVWKLIADFVLVSLVIALVNHAFNAVQVW